MGVLIFDNGAGSAKVEMARSTKPRVIPNCVTKAKTVRARCFTGDQIDECKDLSGLFYLLPFQKGYLVNWEIEKQVWDYIYGKQCLQVDFEDTDLIITEPMFNFSTVQEAMAEILFEEYQFNSALRCNASYLSQLKYGKGCATTPPCTLVVDSGYSFTHITPYYKGKRLQQFTKRLDVGGKLLTNNLKEIISYRQLMVMDETYVMNQCKEDVCFVSTQFKQDMSISRLRGEANTLAVDYVLPDYTHIKRGYVKKPNESGSKQEQVIRMNSERITVPEILFRPSDVGLEQIGVAEAINHVIGLTDSAMQPHFTANILLTGGNCMFPGFKERVYEEVRSATDSFFNVNIHLPSDCVAYAWEGGRVLASDALFEKMAVTRESYNEHGASVFMDSQLEVS
ncbi:actin-related protein 6-like [Watersipora subatra]|uniref:actin-related protein 6-like n=1 Tax=Watersipora subatra TaxID=2589382 RepID=UPI00355C8F6A